MANSIEKLIYSINYIYKTNWPDGPWKLEPDKMLWIDKETGYECLIRRVKEISHLCAYVGITKEHKLYGVSLLQFRRDKLLTKYFDVHGSITMSYPGKHFISEPGPDDKLGRTEVEGLPYPSEIWWIGMDFVQNNDIIPIISDDPSDNNGERIYRDIGYVTKEVTKLAHLLKKFQEEVFEFEKNDYSQQTPPLWQM
jgi:hypothetical protein